MSMWTMYEFGGYMLLIDAQDRTSVTAPEAHPDGVLLRQVSAHPTFVAACEWVKRHGNSVTLPPPTAIEG